jgi:hypothetical protein
MATGTRGTRWSGIPGGRDDVFERIREDAAKGKKGRDVDSSKLSGTAKEVVREAGRRADTRNVGRAGAAQAALSGGYELGRAIDEKTGLGKKIVEKSGLGKAAEKAADRRDKVELSKSAKERLEDMEADEALREVDAERKARKYAEKDKPTEYRGDDEFKRGGRVKKMASGGMTASKRADGIATKGKTKCKMY